ncbi:spore germination protein D [Amphibacillus marinus]|uniref:Spore germination protein D n=1 Tax=Amphibacillus marinus TaxID=872970 RepID=A0A1H8S672_9BACI|nr:spore germination lipoprotein GerD [Amphibacillus marinus]SEO74036.1 spore germination protein D [Amphibacillus marinus]
MVKHTLWFYLAILVFLTACTNNSSSGNGQEGNYDSTKKMVTDILKSEDGKKAIVEVLGDESTQQMYVINDQLVRQAVEQSLTAEEGKGFWSNMFTDTEFVTAFSEAMIAQHEDVLTRLMSDSAYQEKMLELFNNPEVHDQIRGQLKSQQFKTHLEETIQETLASPLFEAKVSEIIIRNAQTLLEEKDTQSEQTDGGTDDEENE